MTPRERAERLIDLKGAIGQADYLVTECERDLAEKGRQFDLAQTARDKQVDNRNALYAEARRLGVEAKADFDALVPVEAKADGLREARLGIGEHHVPLADESADAPRAECEVIGVIPPNAPPMIRLGAAEDNAAVILDGAGDPVGYLGLALSVDEAREQLAEARLNDAFTRATHPQDDTGHPNGAF